MVQDRQRTRICCSLRPSVRETKHLFGETSTDLRTLRECPKEFGCVVHRAVCIFGVFDRARRIDRPSEFILRSMSTDSVKLLECDTNRIHEIVARSASWILPMFRQTISLRKL